MVREARFVIALAALAGACGGAPPEGSTTPVRSTPSAKPPKATGAPALKSAELARVPAGTFGPYGGQGQNGAMLVWAPSVNDKRAWYTLPIAPDGTPDGAPRRVADAPSDIGLVAVRGSLDAAPLVVASTRRTGLGEWVEAMLVREN